MKLFDFWSRATMSAEAEGGAGGSGETVLGGNADPSVMFPGDTQQAATETAAPAAGEWKEFTPDPAKTAEENAAAKVEHDKAKPADPNDKAGQVPADGKYDLTMPEGVELDKELADALGNDFKDLGLTNAQAQKLVDRYIETQQKRMDSHANSPAGVLAMRMQDYFQEAGTPDKWIDAAKNDPAIGGANWGQTEANALRFVKHVNDPALVKYLNASGGGNHPAVISAFAKAGALIREDNPATGGAGGAGKPVQPENLMFTTETPKG